MGQKERQSERNGNGMIKLDSEVEHCHMSGSDALGPPCSQIIPTPPGEEECRHKHIKDSWSKCTRALQI